MSGGGEGFDLVDKDDVEGVGGGGAVRLDGGEDGEDAFGGLGEEFGQ